MLGLFMPRNYRLLPNRFWMNAKTNNTAKPNQIHIMIVSFSEPATARSANFVNSMERSELLAVFSGHSGAVYDAAFWEATGRWVTAAGDGVVAQWDADGQGTALLHHASPFFSVTTFGDWLFAGSASGEVMLMHRDGRPPQRVEAHELGVFALAVAGGGLWSGGGSGAIRPWTFNGDRWQPGPAFRVPDGSKVRTLLPDADRWLVGTSAGWLGTFSPSFGFSRFEDAPETGHYSAVRARDRAAWIVADGDGHLRAYRDDGSLVLAFPAHQGPVYRMVQVGETVWTASRDKSIKAWRTRDLAPVDKVSFQTGGHTRSVNALVAESTPSGWQLLTGGDDRRARLFGLTDSGCLATNPPAQPRIP